MFAILSTVVVVVVADDDVAEMGVDDDFDVDDDNDAIIEDIIFLFLCK
jgi:hypothetical protein